MPYQSYKLLPDTWNYLDTLHRSTEPRCPECGHVSLFDLIPMTTSGIFLRCMACDLIIENWYRSRGQERVFEWSVINLAKFHYIQKEIVIDALIWLAKNKGYHENFNINGYVSTVLKIYHKFRRRNVRLGDYAFG